MQNTMAQDCIAFSTNAAAEPRLFGQVLDGVNGQNLGDEFWIHGSDQKTGRETKAELSSTATRTKEWVEHGRSPCKARTATQQKM